MTQFIYISLKKVFLLLSVEGIVADFFHLQEYLIILTKPSLRLSSIENIKLTSI